MDGVITKAPLGKKSTGPNPTDRSKSGSKRSILVDGKGITIGVSVDGANRHDMKMSKVTLQSIVIYRPEPTIRSKQHMCLDKGYDYPEVYELLEECGYTIHIRLRGGEEGERGVNKRKVILGYRARHWVVERTHSWMNRFRRLLIRWDKSYCNVTFCLCLDHVQKSRRFRIGSVYQCTINYSSSRISYTIYRTKYFKLNLRDYLTRNMR